MDEADRVYRAALAEHHRRVLRLGVPGWVAIWVPLVLRRGRRAWAGRDYLTLTGLGLSLGSQTLTTVVNYRRAERRVGEDLTRQREARETGQRVAQQSTPVKGGVDVPLSALVPAGRSAAGCVAHAGLLTAGWVQAGWDYRHRPGRDPRRVGPRWQWRPGPAWWTAWSFQQLPVNATSTAPRTRQIAYERRQILTVQVTGTAGETINLWDTQLRPALADREWPRLAAGLLKLAAKVVNGVAQYRSVPDKVDAQRARRRRHDAAVAAVAAARAAGLPGPANPWRMEMAVAAASTATIIASFTAQLLANRDRPKPPPADPPRPPARQRPPRAA